MTRRAFVALIGGAAVGWPFVVRGQQTRIPVIGFLWSRGLGDDRHLLTAFRQGLKQTGYVEDENVTIEYRFAENQYNRLPALAADLAGLLSE
jgi:hypothetical protein